MGRRRPTQARAFTLVETAVAIVVVGVGVAGMARLLLACTSQNRFGAQLTTALYLAQNVQEMMADLPFNDPSGAGFGREESGGLLTWNDIDDFDGWSTVGSTPVDSTRQPLAGLPTYAQSVSVSEVNPVSPTTALAGSDCKLVTVRILYRQGNTGTWNEIYRTSWIRMR
jgi:Tfp pilus assembly protein PilV